MSGKRIAVWMALVFLASGAVRGENPTDPLGILLPYVWKGSVVRDGFAEPSGLVFHPGRGTLFAVGDGGDLGEFTTDGKVVRAERLMEADFEGVTCDPATGLLYIIIEGEEKVLEVDPEEFTVEREFALDRKFEGRKVLAKGGQGIEGITFVPDARHPEGGVFYISNQAFELGSEEDLSAICRVALPLRSGGKGKKVAMQGYFVPGMIDISGLHYDAERDLLYAISDATNSLFELTRAGELVRSYALPEQAQEGIAVDAEGFLYIARDSGGIVKYQKK